MSATKTAAANAGVHRNVMREAEAGGIPRSLTNPEPNLPAYDEMSAAEFDWVKATGLAQAMADDSFDLDEVFGELEAGLNGWV